MRSSWTVAALVALLFSAMTVPARGETPPEGVTAYPNAPGAITIVWTHSGEDVFYFVVQELKPQTNYGSEIDRDKRILTISGLTPATTYQFQICAVYASDRQCGDPATVTTLSPPPPAGGTGASAPPPSSGPTAIPQPQIEALVYRDVVDGKPGVHVTWLNAIEGAQRNTLSSIDLTRGGQLIFSGSIDDPGDVDPPGAADYRLCTGNSAGRRCSDPVLAGYFGVGLTLKQGDVLIFRQMRYPVAFTPRASLKGLASFIARPGLDQGARTVSFESAGVVGAFLRAVDIPLVRIDPSDATTDFARQASFKVLPPFDRSKQAGAFQSFESVAFPGFYLCLIPGRDVLTLCNVPDKATFELAAPADPVPEQQFREMAFRPVTSIHMPPFVAHPQ